MKLQEAILRAYEEYTKTIQNLKDFIIKQGNQITLSNSKFILEPKIEWDFILTLQHNDTSLEFSQYGDDENINIKLKNSYDYAQTTVEKTASPQKIIAQANNLYKELTINIEDFTQCVIKVNKKGKLASFVGIVLDATDYANEEEMKQAFQDRIKNEVLILAYHHDGIDEFYDSDGYLIPLDFTDTINASNEYKELNKR